MAVTLRALAGRMRADASCLLPAPLQEYLYIAWNSNTTTRSGYEVRRKNLAVAAVRRGTVYALGCSARFDQWNAAKEEAFQQVVSSFRLYN